MKSQIVAIGGVGGSGTRVVAKIAKEAGIFIGHDLNVALDNLWFALLFVDRSAFPMSKIEFRRRLDIFCAAMTGNRPLSPQETALVIQAAQTDRMQHNRSWLADRAKSLLQFSQQAAEKNQKRYWGWKAPNTHIFLDYLHDELPELKYIHVMRNGLDMAFSENQNQLRIWGDLALANAPKLMPRDSLRYWRWAHERVIDIGHSMKENFLLVRFEELCDFPEDGTRRILDFLDLDMERSVFEEIWKHIKKPKTVGRHKTFDKNFFDVRDIKYVESLGYEVYNE